MQAQHFARQKMNYLVYKGYDNLVLQNKTVINGSNFKDAVVLGNISTDADGISQRLVTVNVYYEDETAPRSTLQQVFYSNDANMYVRNESNPNDSISLRYEDEKITARVNGVDKELGGVPVGTILPWYGKLSEIPSGYSLCNGTNGTPDLRDRFLVGAGTLYSLGEKGGENEVTLEAPQVGSHYHYWGYEHPGNNSGSFLRQNGNTVLNASMLPAGAGYEGWNGSHYSNGFCSMTSYTSNTITSLAVATEAQKPHENRPPYYAVYYIMRVK